MNFNNLTIKSQEALQRAQQVAMGQQNPSIELGHLLKGVLEVDDGVAPYIFKKLGINLNAVTLTLESIVASYPTGASGNQYLSRPATEAIQKASLLLKEFGDEYVALEHLLLGIISVKDTVAQMLKDAGATEKAMKAAVREMRKGAKVTSSSAEGSYNALKKYAVNLNERARDGKIGSCNREG